MKLVQELRERQVFEQPKSANPFPIILGVIVAFCIGAIGVGGFMHAPNFIKLQITEAMTGVGLGKSETSVENNHGRLWYVRAD